MNSVCKYSSNDDYESSVCVCVCVCVCMRDQSLENVAAKKNKT